METEKANWLCFAVSFFGQEYRGRQALCAGLRDGNPHRVKDEVPWQVEGSRSIGSRVKRLAQGELMPCVNSYWVLPDAEIRRFGGFAAASPSGKISKDWRDEN